jgi:hypothetical protein
MAANDPPVLRVWNPQRALPVGWWQQRVQVGLHPRQGRVPCDPALARRRIIPAPPGARCAPGREPGVEHIWLACHQLQGAMHSTSFGRSTRSTPPQAHECDSMITPLLGARPGCASSASHGAAARTPAGPTAGLWAARAGPRSRRTR